MSQKEVNIKNGSFLRSDEQRWVSSSLFYFSANCLAIRDSIYYLPQGTTLSNIELVDYVDSIFDALAALETTTKEEKEYRNYVFKIAQILRQWAREGYQVTLV